MNSMQRPWLSTPGFGHGPPLNFPGGLQHSNPQGRGIPQPGPPVFNQFPQPQYRPPFYRAAPPSLETQMPRENLNNQRSSDFPEHSISGLQDSSQQQPPSPPADPEIVKNIEVLLGFVVKNGPGFERMARAKQVNNPKFAFLFGGEPGSEEAASAAFYEWRKKQLTAGQDGHHVSESKNEAGDERLMSTAKAAHDVHETLQAGAPGSPIGSDMEMEDDFVPPGQARKIPVPSLQQEGGKIPPTSNALSRPQELLPMDNQNFSQRRTPSHQGGYHAGPSSSRAEYQSGDIGKRQPVIDENLQRRGRRMTGFDRPAMVDISTPVAPKRGAEELATPPEHTDGRANGSVPSPKRRRSSRSSRWEAVDDVPVVGSHLLETVGGPTVVASNEEGTPLTDGKQALGEATGKESSLKVEGGPSKASVEGDVEAAHAEGERVHVDIAGAISGSGEEEGKETLSKGKATAEEETAGPEKDRQRDQEEEEEEEGAARPATAEEVTEKLDEFGRIIRPSGSDSESDRSERRRGRGRGGRSRSPEGRTGGRRRSERRSRSRSTSRSPGRQSRWASRNRSPRGGQDRNKFGRVLSQEPKDRGREWSGSGRSWDHSGRAGREGSSRGEREGNEPNSSRRRGGGEEEFPGRRNWGREQKAQQACYDYSKGRCNRGTACKFLHSDPESSDLRMEGRRDDGKQLTEQDKQPWWRSSESTHESSKASDLPVPDLPQPTATLREAGGKVDVQAVLPTPPKLAALLLTQAGVPAWSTQLQGAHSLAPGTGHLQGPPVIGHSFYPTATADPSSGFAFQARLFGGNVLPLPPSSTAGTPYDPLADALDPLPALTATGVHNPAGHQHSGALVGGNGYVRDQNPAESPLTPPPDDAQPSQALGPLVGAYSAPPQGQYSDALHAQHDSAQQGGAFTYAAPVSENTAPPEKIWREAEAGPDMAGTGHGVPVDELGQHLPDVNQQFAGEKVADVYGGSYTEGAVSTDIPRTEPGIDMIEHDNEQGAAPASRTDSEPLRATNGGDIEEDGLKMEVREEKESKGVALLRAAVADCVKAALKPKWKGGGISKEAFKVIAKKTVDKVVASVDPLSFAKGVSQVDAYMSSSRKEKIGKLVQGYIDKYAKA